MISPAQVVFIDNRKRKMSARECFAVYVLFSTSGTALAQKVLEHRRPAFTVTIPAPFERFQELETGNMLYLFKDRPLDSPGLVIGIQDLGGVIGTERHYKSEIPPDLTEGTDIDLEYWPFKADGVNVFVSRMQVEDLSCLSLNAQVPFRERGIGFYVSGPAVREPEIRSVLKALLASCDGPLMEPGQLGPGYRLLSTRERIFRLAWSGPNLAGWIGLFFYGLYRLGISGRVQNYLRARKSWLGLVAVCLFVGAAGRMYDFDESAVFEHASALLSLSVAFLVLLAYHRVGRQSVRRDSPELVADGNSVMRNDGSTVGPLVVTRTPLSGSG